jgi:hypothetical protein
MGKLLASHISRRLRRLSVPEKNSKLFSLIRWLRCVTCQIFTTLE